MASAGTALPSQHKINKDVLNKKGLHNRGLQFRGCLPHPLRNTYNGLPASTRPTALHSNPCIPAQQSQNQPLPGPSRKRLTHTRLPLRSIQQTHPCTPPQHPRLLTFLLGLFFHTHLGGPNVSAPRTQTTRSHSSRAHKIAQQHHLHAGNNSQPLHLFSANHTLLLVPTQQIQKYLNK